MRHLFTFLLLFSFSVAEELDDLLGEFDEEVVVSAQSQKAPEKASWISFNGDYTFSTSYNYQDKAFNEGFSRARNSINLVFDMDFSKVFKAKLELKTLYDPLLDGDQTKQPTKNLAYLSELREAYVSANFSSIDIQIGRQITVWGKSDNIRITDVINPLDNREIGMVDIENLRLPIMGSKFSYFTGKLALKLLFIHEARVQREAGVGSEFFPSSMFPSGFTVPAVNDPESKLENTQYAFSADGTFSGWDLSAYAAKVFDQRWYISGGQRYYKMITMHGIAFNIPLGSWLFKTEAAFLEGLRYSTTSDEKKRLDALVGLEYSGVTDLTLSLEVANRHIYDYETVMRGAVDYVRENEVQTALRASYSFDHDNATLTYLASVLGPKFEDGGMNRLSLEYKFNDSVTLTTGYIDYMSGDRPYFEAISYNDRIFFDYKWSF